MRKILLLMLCPCPVCADSQEGVPFFVNYPPFVYQTHNRNFDVVCDSCGNVYLANFEGILHYDYDRWETIYTPRFSRVTRLFRDSGSRVWAGGYNVFGRIEHDERGCVALRTIMPDLDPSSFDELDDMVEVDGLICLKTTSGRCYMAQEDTLLFPIQILPVQLQEKWQKRTTLGDVDRGLSVNDDGGKELFSMTENNGLCSSSISSVATDGRGNPWGATGNGVSHVFTPSLFSRFTSCEGLKGEVVSVTHYKGMLYAGTLQGLCVWRHNVFVPVKGVTQACWQLVLSPEGELYAATSDGIYAVGDYGRLRKFTKVTARSLVFTDGADILMGAMDGIYRYFAQTRKVGRVSGIEEVVHLEAKRNHSI